MQTYISVLGLRNRIIGLSIVLFGTIPSAFAADTVPAVTMDQPNNGFYEGPSPEWATLHSTDLRGTEEHRQYHRDAVRALNVWLEEHRVNRGTASYNNAHRIVVQERNLEHRLFHTDPQFVHNSTPPATNTPTVTQSNTNNTGTALDRTATGRPSRRSVIADAEQQNAARAVRN